MPLWGSVKIEEEPELSSAEKAERLRLVQEFKDEHPVAAILGQYHADVTHGRAVVFVIYGLAAAFGGGLFFVAIFLLYPVNLWSYFWAAVFLALILCLGWVVWSYRGGLERFLRGRQ